MVLLWDFFFFVITDLAFFVVLFSTKCVFHAIEKVSSECSVQVHSQVNINLIIKLVLLNFNRKQ